jgi:hypothetical protein
MGLLSRRIDAIRDCTIHTLVHAHPLLPRQRLRVTLSPALIAILRTNRTIGVIARQATSDGCWRVLSHGVEAIVDDVNGSTVTLVGGPLIALSDDRDRSMDVCTSWDEFYAPSVRRLNLVSRSQPTLAR